MNVTNFIRSLKAEAMPKLLSTLVIAINKFSSSCLGESQKLAPVKTGHLVASGFLDPAGGSKGLNATIGYSAEYAIYVHENIVSINGNLIFHSQGQAKFLEITMRRNENGFMPFVAQELQEAFS